MSSAVLLGDVLGDHADSVPDPLVVALLALVVLFGLLASVLAAGAILNRIEMRWLGDGSGFRDRAGQSAAEQFIGSLYTLTIGSASLAFYVVSPVIAAVAVGTAGVLLWGLAGLAGSLHFSLGSVRLLAVLAMLAFLVVGSVVAVIGGLVSRPKVTRAPKRVRRGEEPDLFAALDQAAGFAGARLVGMVELTPSADIEVREEGGLLELLRGRGTPVMSLGLAALDGMTMTEARSIFVHEMGHVSHGETRITPLVARVITRMATIVSDLKHAEVVAIVNPAYWFVAGYLRALLRISRAHGRRRELYADRAAARAYGGAAFARALRKVVEAQHFMAGTAILTVAEVRRFGLPARQMLTALSAVRQALSPEAKERSWQKALAATPGPFDSHPPVGERVRLVVGVGDVDHDERPAWSLFKDFAALDLELSPTLASAADGLLKRLELRAHATPLVPVEKEQDLAVAAGAYAEATGAATENPARIDAVGGAIDHLAGILGARSIGLAEPLLRLGRLELAAGNPSRASQAVQRALPLLAAAPGHEVQFQEAQALDRAIREQEADQARRREAASAPAGTVTAHVGTGRSGLQTDVLEALGLAGRELGALQVFVEPVVRGADGRAVARVWLQAAYSGALGGRLQVTSHEGDLALAARQVPGVGHRVLRWSIPVQVPDGVSALDFRIDAPPEQYAPRIRRVFPAADATGTPGLRHVPGGFTATVVQGGASVSVGDELEVTWEPGRPLPELAPAPTLVAPGLPLEKGSLLGEAQ